MIAVMLAASAAFFFALGAILARRSLVDSNFLSATVIITAVGAVIFLSLVLLVVPIDDVNLTGVVLFAAAGVLAPGLVRLCYFKGMEKLGVSINASIFATYPIFGSLFAIFLLNEQPTLGIWMGIILIVAGAVLVERNTRNVKVNSGRISKKSMILPLLAAMFLGWAYVIRKMGLNIYDEPIMGACLSYIAALSLYALLPRLSTYVRRSLSFNMKNLRLFWKSGVCICAAWFCAYYAIRYGDVAVVSPIVDTEPLFIALLAYVYLKDLETISLKLAAGTLIIVLGVSFITMF